MFLEINLMILCNIHNTTYHAESRFREPGDAPEGDGAPRHARDAAQPVANDAGGRGGRGGRG